tara:strand:+ start:14756 stop:15367 length:612 start_codon:yes stop_codon:yes gene_type:complete
MTLIRRKVFIGMKKLIVKVLREETQLNESTVGDIVMDIGGDAAMAAVGSFDGLDIFVLVPAALKNLQEIYDGMEETNDLMYRFVEEPEKHRKELKRSADGIIMDIIDLAQRLIESMPGSIFGSAASFLGGTVGTNILMNTLGKNAGEKFAELVAKVPQEAVVTINKTSISSGFIGLNDIPEALTVAGRALTLIDAYDKKIKNT